MQVFNRYMPVYQLGTRLPIKSEMYRASLNVLLPTTTVLALSLICVAARLGLGVAFSMVILLVVTLDHPTAILSKVGFSKL